MIEEVWVDIEGFEGLYQVSSMGRVKSFDRVTRNIIRPFIKKGRILKPNPDGHGYVYVTLFKDGIRSRVKVHRLVANAFIPNPENKPEIDHINSIRDDNRLENLRWVTRSENNKNPIWIERQRAAAVGRVILPETRIKISQKCKGHRVNMEAIQKMAESRMRAVEAYDANWILIKSFKNLSEACEFANVSKMAIVNACKGKTKTSGGYKWKYKQL